MERFKKLRFSTTSNYSKKYIWSGFKTWKKETGFEKNKNNSIHVVAIDYGIKKIF